MLGEGLEIGDKVIIDISKESREWGYNPYPDGTVVEVIRFSEIHYTRINNFGYKPGVYVNHSWVYVSLEGKEVCITTCYLKPYDVNKYEQKLKINKNASIFIRNLPETEFCEGDIIRLKKSNSFFENDKVVISRIDYSNVSEKRIDGSPMPIYSLSNDIYGNGGSIFCDTQDIELVERGKVWKYYHNEPIVFDTTKEEGDFHNLLGLVDEVRNPKTNNYSWDITEILKAIKAGLVHGFVMSSGGWICAKRFRNVELGERVAKETLKGFEQK